MVPSNRNILSFSNPARSLFSEILFNKPKKAAPSALIIALIWLALSLILGAAAPLATQAPAQKTATATQPAPASIPTQPKPATPNPTNLMQNLPLGFESNAGQMNEQIKFSSRTSGYTFSLTNNAMLFTLPKPDEAKTKPKTAPQSLNPQDYLKRGQELPSSEPQTFYNVQMKWEGGNPSPELVGVGQMPGYSNYFIGNDPTKWRSNVPNYERVEYREIYPGINLAFYGNQQQLEYDFVVSPGADPNQIILSFEGANSLEINSEGALVLHTEAGPLVQKAPSIYQQIGNEHRPVEGHYQLLPPTQESTLPRVGFSLTHYDPTYSLTIDPLLIYSTFIGGAIPTAIKRDSSGNIYIAGTLTLIEIASIPFPVTPGVFQTNRSSDSDGFIVKLNPTATLLLFSTYLGGNEAHQIFSTENLNDLVLDATGNIYVTGYTSAPDFPVTQGAYQTVLNNGEGPCPVPLTSCEDVFVTKLNSTGTALIYSTLLGGIALDQSSSIAVDNNGNVYIAGSTGSSTFPTTPGVLQPTPGGNGDAFVAKFNSTGTTLIFSTLLGGSNFDTIGYLTLDTSGNIYVTGQTQSTNFPVTPGAFQNIKRGTSDAFITKINPNGTALLASTYLGGSFDDGLSNLILDQAGNVFVAGSTTSEDFPITPGAFQTVNYGGAGVSDGFLTKLNSNLSSLIYSSYIGGTGGDSVSNISLDSSGNLYAIGDTSSSDFPTTPDALQSVFGGASDVVVAKINPTGTSLLYSTYLGGASYDQGTNIILDENNDIYITGSANSGYPTTPDQLIYQGTTALAGAFITKLDMAATNTTWATAQPLTFNNNTATVQKILGQPEASLWYKFSATPDSRIAITLTGPGANAALPANFDLVLYKDIQATYNKTQVPPTVATLPQLSAKSAPYSFLPYSFLPYSFLPYSFLPYSFLPYSFLPYSFLPYSFLKADGLKEPAPPYQFRKADYVPYGYQATPYATAIERSIMAISAQSEKEAERISFNTGPDAGDFYIAVKSATGAGSSTVPFQLQVTVDGGVCGSLAPVTGADAPAPTGQFKTIIVTDLNRMPGTSAEKTAMLSKLISFAARPEVQGAVIDLSDATKYQRVINANSQADAKKDCAFAKNLVAQEIKKVIDSYRAGSPNLQYVVLAGPDSVIPFYRSPDKAGLAPESDFSTPLIPTGSAQAALSTNLVLNQDYYGSSQDYSQYQVSVPFPELAVGRLVEDANDISGMLDAYVATNGVITPKTSLVTGYDFVEDVALAVKSELEGATGQAADTLINPQSRPASDPLSWTASDLRAKLLTNRHDLIFLAGHFSPGYAEAADATTSLAASEIAGSSLDLTNVLLFSVGCHSGYNISPEDNLSPLSEEPDWAQALAKKKVTAVLGTGYQYGDTELIEYSERFYLEFTRQLHTRQDLSSGPAIVPIGQALVKAKQHYMATALPFDGLPAKVVMEATLYGLPMLKVNLAGRDPQNEPAVVAGATPVATGPGATLNLSTADYTLTPTLIQHSRTLTDTSTNTPLNALYYEGASGYSVSGIDPVLPLEMRNVSLPNKVLRGVGFRGGSYTDQSNVFPLALGPSTEYSRARASFESLYYYPEQLWSANLAEALTGGNTRLSVVPAQFKSSAPGSLTGTLRKYDNLNLRLFYSSEIGQASLASAPGILSVKSTDAGNGTVSFQVKVDGASSAGIQGVWITYASTTGLPWQSFDLTYNPTSKLAEGTLTLPGGYSAANLNFMVQAVNGVGLVILASNGGGYYPVPFDSTPAAILPNAAVPTFTINQLPTSVAYLDQVTFQVTLSSANGALSNQQAVLELGGQSFSVNTDANGMAQVTTSLHQPPGTYFASASFPGNSSFKPVSVSKSYTVALRATNLSFTATGNGTAQYSDPTRIEATLTENGGQPLGQKGVVFVGTLGNCATNCTFATTVQTDYQGRARFTDLSWPAGSYSVRAYFSGNIPVVGTQEDLLYAPSATPAGNPLSLTITPEDATLSYTGATTISDFQIKAKVTPSNDGTPGNLSLAQIKLDVKNPSGTVVYSSTQNAGLDGNLNFSLLSLSSGSYSLEFSFGGGYYTGTLLSQPITLEACLYLTSHIDSGTNACGTLTRAINEANQVIAPSQSVTITFAEGAVIQVQTLLPKVNNANQLKIVLQGVCGLNASGKAVPNVEISRSGNYTGAGFSLGSNVTLKCLKIAEFNQGQVLVSGRGNWLINSLLQPPPGAGGLKLLVGGRIQTLKDLVKR